MNSASRVVARLAVIIAVLATGLVAASPAQADRSFDLRFTATDTGSIKGIANANMTCPAAGNNCLSPNNAREAAVTASVNTSNDWRNNNGHSMVYVDVDSDPSTFNSSSANQSLPPGSTILYAALYWGGHYSGATSPANASLRDQVQFKLPGSASYQTVNATTLDDGVGGNAGRYQAFADVTGLIQALPNSGNGTYAVGNIQSATGSDRYAGWSLIVAYKNSGETVKNMTIFDGLVSISGTTTANIPISGFLTPPSGPINGEIGFVTWEGDLGLNGDRAQVNGQYLSDAQHPSTNFFDSRISHNGVLYTDRDPAYPNSLGMDAAWTTPPPGAIGNSESSATITVNSTGDQYLPGVITFQVEVFSPKIDQVKTVTDENGGEVEPGDVLTYRIAGRNNGLDGATDFVLNDPIPAGTSYVPGTIEIVENSGSSTGSQTDAAGDDLAEFGPGGVTARFGTGSDATQGGTVSPGGEYEITFKVKVDDDIAPETEVENVATASFVTEATGTPLEVVSTTKVTTAAEPLEADVEIVKTAAPPNPGPGEPLSYTLKVKNNGPGEAKDVVVTDSLPVGVTFVSADAPCTEASGTVTCELGTLAPGEEVLLGIEVTVDPWGTVNPGNSHLVDVQKVEAQIDLEPGETSAVEVACPAGFFATDGSVRIDHVDQDGGDWDRPQVLKSAAGSESSWTGVVRNTATGRAQAKIFAVCLRKTTSPNGHIHKFKLSDPVTVTKSISTEITEATLECGPGKVAVQPGFDATVAGHLLYSQPEGNGWKFRYSTVGTGGDVTFSIRCLNRQLKSESGHTHDLGLERIWSEVEIGPNQVHEVQLTCPDGSKGIVGGWDLDKKLIPLGNDPRPVTRAFKVYNPSGKNQTARFSLLCLGDRTGGEVLAPKWIVNTAHVSTSTPDPDAANNSSTVGVKARDGETTAPIDDGSGKPVVNNPTGNGKDPKASCRIVGRSVKYRNGKVIARLRCSGKTKGVAKLTSIRKVKVAGNWYAKGTLLAKGRYRFAAAGTKKVTLKATWAGRKIIRKGKARRARLDITGGASRVVKVNG